MRFLFLNLASHDGLLACVTEQAVVARTQLHTRASDADLITAFEHSLRDARWSPAYLTHLACIIGPGGFTSLRVAVSFMNTLSFSLRLPLCGIHLSDLFFARSPIPDLSLVASAKWDPRSPMWWLHSTKAQEIFVRGFDMHASAAPTTKHVQLRNLSEIIGDSPQWCGELLPTHAELLHGLGGNTVPLRPLEEVLPSFLAGQTYVEQQLVPWYGRAG